MTTTKMPKLILFSALFQLFSLILGAPVIKPHHGPLNEPGSMDQILEAWEEEDGMNRTDFDAKSFFLMHDLDGDHELSWEEIDVILERETEKLGKGDPHVNSTYVNNVSREMRDYFMEHFDKDHNGKISMEEFLHSMGHSEEKTKEWVPHEDKVWNETARVQEEHDTQKRVVHVAQQLDPSIGIQPGHSNVAPQFTDIRASDTLQALETQLNMQPGVPVAQVLQNTEFQGSQQVPQAASFGQPQPEQAQLKMQPMTQFSQNTGFQGGQEVPQAGAHMPSGQISQTGHIGSPSVQPVQGSVEAHRQEAHSDPSGQQFLSMNQPETLSEIPANRQPR